MFAREYELVYITRPDIPDEDLDAIKERTSNIITEREGHVLSVDDSAWGGKRRLAYEIRKFSKGHYVLLTYLGGPDIVDEVERTLKIDDNILRFLHVKADDRVEIEPRLVAAKEAAARALEMVEEEDEDDDEGLDD